MQLTARLGVAIINKTAWVVRRFAPHEAAGR